MLKLKHIIMACIMLHNLRNDQNDPCELGWYETVRNNILIKIDGVIYSHITEITYSYKY